MAGSSEGEGSVVGLAPVRLSWLGSGRAEHLAIRVIIAKVSEQCRIKALGGLNGWSGLLWDGAMDGVGAVGSHLQLVSASNGGLLLSKDGLLLGGQVGEPLRLGDGLLLLLLLLLLLRVCGILMHFGAVAVIVVLWKIVTIFVSCITHFERAALFVFSNVWVLLEGEEGNEFSGARWLFHAREASTGTPLVKLLTEGVILCLYEAEFTGGDGPLTTLGVNEGDGRVDDGALRGAADCSKVGEHCGEILHTERFGACQRE